MNDRNRPAQPVRQKRPRYEEPYEPKKKFPLWTIPVIIVSVCLLAGAWVYAESLLTQYDRFNQMRAAVVGDTFNGAVYIDNVPVTGLTMDEARERLTDAARTQASAFEVTIVAGDDSWRIAPEDVPMTWDTESLLQKAYKVGRGGTLEQRYQQITDVSEPVFLKSEFSYDRGAIRQVTDEIAAQLTVEPVNAAVVAFDVAKRTFAFADEQPGQTVDGAALYQAVIDKLDNGQYGETVHVQVVDKQPSVTRAALDANYKRIATYTTKTTDDSNRNTNIDLASQEFHGRMIPAGGTISFNETTGQRTRDKGYKEAGAIENGRTIKEIGGGICQVSSTLFNAMLRADCEIVSRKPHAWPSDYVPRGEDATVDWPNLDLVMRNPSDAPMFITAWYEDQTVTVEIYGLSLGDGRSVELESVTTYERKPTEVVYTYNGDLAVGTNQLLKKPRTGYSVDTYKIILQNGQEVSREKLYTSDYRAINEEYEYNDGNPPPVPEA